VIRAPGIELDPREAEQLIAELMSRRAGYLPELLPSEEGPDAAIVQSVARYVQAILRRLNQAPEKNKLAFLEMMGIRLIPAQSARAPVVFQLAENVADARVPAGTRVAAPPPPESNDQIAFETERSTGVTSARLKEVVSLWPGRDQYIDHRAAFLAGEPFQPFQKSQLKDTPHILYLAHGVLLALAGESKLDVTFELTTGSSQRLDLLWEYWDGKVWREFRYLRPECGEELEKLDSSAGLTHSGTFRLETDCAETQKTTVSGVEAFWVRGRLTAPLPPNPAVTLPEVDRIRLGTEITRPLKLSWSWTPGTVRRDQSQALVRVLVRDDAGTPLRGVWVEQLKVGKNPGTNPQLTDVNGSGDFFTSAKERLISVLFSPSPGLLIDVIPGLSVPGIPIVAPFPLFTGEKAEKEVPLVTFDLKMDGLDPDKAFADALAIDVSTPFFPLGLQPLPGASFYFSSEEVFSKPGARVVIYLQTAPAPQDQLPVGSSQSSVSTAAGISVLPVQEQPLQHAVSWEYWNGRSWAAVSVTEQPPADGAGPRGPNDPSPLDLTGTGVMELTVPDDMEPTRVNDEEGRWMRLRLAGGSYGFTRRVTWTVTNVASNEFTYVVTQPPAVSKFLLGYTWQYGPFPPEHVFAYNDFRYIDRTEEAKWPGQSFQPYRPVGDVTPALYLGFEKQLPVDRLGLFFDILEERGQTEGPALLWQYWDGVAWEEVVVEDETRNLRVPGIASLIGPDDSQPLARFDQPLHWLRARLKEDGPPGEPRLRGIFPNAVWAVQHQTVVDEPLGASTGAANQLFAFRQIPVLEGERIEVRELGGLRANVEWRIVARELFGGDARLIREVEAMLASEGPQTEVQQGDLRLMRDRNRRVTEVWVRWESRRHLFSSGPHDRHYVLERARGRLLFGDGVRGRIPPLGAAILARRYRSGGGLKGNVAARAITQVLGPVGGVEAVFNPLPAGGGGDGESAASVVTRGPQTIRHRGRALSPQDYETLAREANASVAVARALACRDVDGRQAPGWVTLVIVPQSAEPRPWPSFELRDQVQRFVAERASADLAAARHIYVTGPDYQAVDVEATIVPLDPAAAGAVEADARQALETFLHPLRGGREGRGWPPGQDVFLSDVAAVLERVTGVDYVKELGLLLNGALQGEHVRVLEDRIVVAGAIRLKLVEA
jgi:hypothetical protein